MLPSMFSGIYSEIDKSQFTVQAPFDVSAVFGMADYNALRFLLVSVALLLSNVSPTHGRILRGFRVQPPNECLSVLKAYIAQK